MFRYLTASFLLILFISETNAQQSLKGRIGFAFGYQSGIEFFNFNSINSSFLKHNEKGFSDNLNLGGISGYLYFLILPDTRMCFNYLNAKKEAQVTDGKLFYFLQSLWNFGFEYTISQWHLNISPGIFFGKIQDYLELSFYDGSKDFNILINQFKTQNLTNGSIYFENHSYHIAPSINLEYSLSRFLSVRLNYFYIIRLNERWKFLRHSNVDNIPEELVNNNHIINIGLLIGFFSK